MTNGKQDVHLCPILMRTVIWVNGKCTVECGEITCPVFVAQDENRINSGV